MKRSIIIFFILSYSINFFAQNLIKNGDFENYSELPYDISQIDFSPNWKSMNGGADYFHRLYDFSKTRTYSIHNTKCNYSVPNNDQGNQYPKSGNAYAGIAHLDYEVKEIIYTKLIKPLEKNYYYKVEFYVSLAEMSKYATSNIGAYFPVGRYKTVDLYRSDKVTDYVRNSDNNYLNSYEDWMKVSCIYKAKGGEQYLSIGYFGPFNPYDWQKINGKPVKERHKDKIWAYYYIDDVSLYEVDSLGNMITPDTVQVAMQDTIIKNLDTLEVGQTFVLEKISFDYNKSELLPSSFEFLDELADYLQKNSTVKIEINGYTDNTGYEEANKQLSENRAKSVFEYLVGVGILQERMKYKGLGSANPIADNSSEQGREKNRRVEVKVVER